MSWFPATSRRAGFLAAAALAFEPLSVPAQSEPAVQLPPANGGYDSQLGGSYAPAPGVAVVSRDREDPPAEGLYSICYLNAFQTQAHEAGWWKANHTDLLLRDEAGRHLEDKNWPGEILLDTSSENKRAAILSVIGPWIDRCAKDGFQAIEPDNLDSWTRSRGKLRVADNVVMAQLIVGRAHANGMAAAQKNASELGAVGKLIAGFDFAIVESCQEYGECGKYTEVYGDRVFEIEYREDDQDFFAAACAERGATISIVLRDPGLSSPENPDYRHETC